MQKRYVVALDQGTTSCRAVVFDRGLRVVAAAQKPFAQHYPRPGWVEHDAMEIYATQSAVLWQALLQNGISAREVAAVGIANQRETTVLWDKKTGLPVGPAIVWQCRRTAALCGELRARGLDEEVRARTGLTIDAYFSATKIRWMLDNIPSLAERAKRGEILFGTIDSWLCYKFTGDRVHITDRTNASRTMLYNICTLDWDDVLLEALDIPRSMLPDVADSSAHFGTLTLDSERIPILGVAGDQQAALFGQGCFEPGEIKNTYGTGGFLLMNTGERLYQSENGLISTIAASFGGKVGYALEGSIFIAGAVIQWLRDELGLLSYSADSEAAAMAVPDSGGVYFVPAFTGLGAPYWDMDARGAIVGLTRGSNKNHIIRAALESIAHQTADVTDAMQADTGLTVRRLRVDGGASENDFLMQFQADLLGAEVVRPAVTESTALGAAALAGLGCGFWKSRDELAACLSVDRVFSPAFSAQGRDAARAGWREAVGRVRTVR